MLDKIILMEQVDLTKLISKKHVLTSNKKLTPRVRIDNKSSMNFNKGAAELLGMSHGRYAHFIPSTNHWNVIVNDDKTGFRIIHERKDRHEAGMRVICAPLVAYFKEQTRFKVLPATFYVKLSDTVEYDGKPVGEITIHKSIEELLKQAQ